jgi:hypothetical protein
MFKKVKDLAFSLALIFLIAVGVYWLMVEMQKDYLNHYIGLLGDKLIALVPESSEKRTLQSFFDDFKKQVENQEVTPDQVERVAAGILNISNLKDSISVAEAKAVLRLGESMPDSQMRRRPDVGAVRSKRSASRESEVRWRDLGERLESIYKLDQKIKAMPDSIKPLYRFDGNLNIVIDDQARTLLHQKEFQMMSKEIQELEKEKALIWRENVSNELDNIRLQLRILRENHELARIKNFEKIVLFDPTIDLDSLRNISVGINIDSLNIIVEKELDRIKAAEHGK